MSTFKEQTALLDQLQKELNHVLEHTGRMFAAVSANPKVAPTAQKERLKRELPAATNRFHENLDQLEAQLHLARLVLRRDLAVIREKTAKEEPAPTNDATNAADGDINMDLDPPTEAANVKSSDETEPKAEAQPSPDVDTAMEDIPDASDSQAKKTSDDATSKDTDSKDTKPAALSLDTTSADSKPNATATAGGGGGDEDSVPGTANTNADLDSLFGGPMSAVENTGGDGQEKDRKSANEASATNNNNDDDDIFNFDSNPTDTNDNNPAATNGDEIDFGSFGADNDNISSLLPGLQDYANPSGGDDGGGGGGGENGGGNNDFDSIFGIGDGGGGDGQTTTGGGDGEGDPAPFNFDDFSFDVDAGAGGTSGGGDGGAGDGTVGDYDFDSIFN